MAEAVADRLGRAEHEFVTGDLNGLDVARRGEGEPEWLARRRLHAWKVYETTPMPTERMEEWRYTDRAQRLSIDQLHVPSIVTLRDDPDTWPQSLKRAMGDDPDTSGHLVLLGGSVVYTDIQPSLACQGVVRTSLRKAVE